MSKPNDRSSADQLIDLLADMVAERMRTSASRQAQPASKPPAPPSTAKPAAAAPPKPAKVDAKEEIEEEETLPPLPPASPHAARMLGRLAMGLLLMVILINIPINCHGTTLATAMPDAQSLAIRDGLVIKVEDEPEIYVYSDGAFHWISSMDAFEHYGYTWDDVRVVGDGFMQGFEIEEPIHVLLKCNDSPHVYRLENGTKRWIVDIPTFEREGYVWERDIKHTTCAALRGLPDGETIPPGHGPAPQP